MSNNKWSSIRFEHGNREAYFQRTPDHQVEVNVESRWPGWDVASGGQEWIYLHQEDVVQLRDQLNQWIQEFEDEREQVAEEGQEEE